MAIGWAAVLACLAAPGRAAEDPPAPDPVAYKRLSLEELMDIEVVSVSRRPEKLSETASAIQVITGDDIHRSGASSLPEALRLLPNLQVAQVNSSQWAISARGFDNVLANKMLVLIDGRTVYTPLYAGVYWDVQNVFLEDIDRVEVVSGPGGALWGANAINGVINVISKSARDTQGTSVTGAAGTAQRDFAGIRSGGCIGQDLYMRVYGQRFDRRGTVLTDGRDAGDGWDMTQGGFRVDWEPGGDIVTLQGDVYDGSPNPDGATPVTTQGGNALGRWTHAISPRSDLQVQAYYDRTMRDLGNGFAEDLDTYDVDCQNRFPLGGRQQVIWGLGYRLMDDRERNLPLFGFLPAHQRLSLYSAFVQDEIMIVQDRLRLVLGSKFEHNDYTGFECQPSGRLAWNPVESQTVWGAVSRAVRTPSRIDSEFSLLATPTFPIIASDDGFRSEKVIAYELGWRAQALERLSCSVAAFYNDYDDIRTAEPGPPPFGLPITFANGLAGHTYGAELSSECQVIDAWRLRGGYTFLRKRLRVKPGSQDLNRGTAESDDPEHQVLVQSMVDLPRDLEFDVVVRYVAPLPDPHVPGYVGLDVRLGYHPTERLELSVVGQNLVDDRHPEFVPASPSAREIERSAYGAMTIRW